MVFGFLFLYRFVSLKFTSMLKSNMVSTESYRLSGLSIIPWNVNTVFVWFRFFKIYE